MGGVKESYMRYNQRHNQTGKKENQMAKQAIGNVKKPAEVNSMSSWWLQEMIQLGAEELQFEYVVENEIAATIKIAITPDIEELFKLLQSANTQRVTAVKSEKKRIYWDPTNFLDAYHQARMLEMEGKKDVRITNKGTYGPSENESYEDYTSNCWSTSYWEKHFKNAVNNPDQNWVVSYIDSE